MSALRIVLLITALSASIQCLAAPPKPFPVPGGKQGYEQSGAIEVVNPGASMIIVNDTAYFYTNATGGLKLGTLHRGMRVRLLYVMERDRPMLIAVDPDSGKK